MGPSKRVNLRVVVVGAGAFGGWTALALLERGATVTLVDAWGPGNRRGSSGDETRVMRSMYGSHRVYVELVTRAVELWRLREREWQRPLYQRTGLLWMFAEDDEYARISMPLLAAAGARVDDLSLAAAASRFPQIDFKGVRSTYYEHEAGILLARESCRAVCDAVRIQGGTYVETAIRPHDCDGGSMGAITGADGERLEGDVFVFACGAWLGGLFPQFLGDHIIPTRQEIYHFGSPPGDHHYVFPNLPVWIDFSDRIRYGVPNRGALKVADDTRGSAFDPTADDRVPTQEGVAAIRAFLSKRFPGLRTAPLLDARVCPYENSPDGHLIVDRHPDAANAWIVGGGSGHGFKLGPALGEYVADCILSDGIPAPEFALRRLGAVRQRATQFESGLR